MASKWIHSLVLARFLVIIAAREEFCDGETFSAQCPPNDVILMTSALYGRMAMGRCVTANFGSIGCESDVLRSMDGKCSGRRNCEIEVIHRSLFLEPQTCHKDLSSYLLADFTCVTVLDVSAACHAADHALRLTSSPIYLLGKDAISLPCLNQQSRSIKIQASPGQLITTSLVDFRQTAASNSRSSCVEYGVIIESTTRQQAQICGGQGRERHLITSNSNELEIEWSNPDEPHFMLKFEVLGCPDLATPRFGWVEREEDEIRVGCDHSKQTWHLRCQGNRWEGVVGNCSARGSARNTLIAGQEDENTAIPRDVVMTMIIAGCIVASIAVITIGAVCWRRKHMEAQIAKLKSSVGKAGPGGARPDSEYMMPSYPAGGVRDETEDALYDFCFTPGNAPNNLNAAAAAPNAVTLPFRNSRNLVLTNGLPDEPQYKTLVVVRPH